MSWTPAQVDRFIEDLDCGDAQLLTIMLLVAMPTAERIAAVGEAFSLVGGEQRLMEVLKNLPIDPARMRPDKT